MIIPLPEDKYFPYISDHHFTHHFSQFINMSRNHISMWWLLFLVFLSHSCSLVPRCHHEQSSALLQFKSSFNLTSSSSYECDLDAKTSFPKTTSWKNGTNCCLWDGVTCDANSGHVIGLDLSCSWLRGELHPNSSLFSLVHLQKLNLAHNSFNRSPISSEFGQFVGLTHLNLSSSVFSGEIPLEISRLSKLVLLDLSLNDLSLRLAPLTWKRLIQNVTNLKELVLDSVNMLSVGLNFLQMNLSSSLTSLSLTGCAIEGNLANNILYLPNLHELYLSLNKNLKGHLTKSNLSSSLKILDLSNTSFSGELPDSIGHLKSLNYLDLSDCNFSGSIPASFWNLKELAFLNLGGNNFIGKIPSSLSNLEHLISLDLSQNNFCCQIPDVFSRFRKLTHLSFSANNLRGKFPLSLFELTQISFLDFSSNHFVGPLPNNVTGFSVLIYLDLSNNLLTGTIPSWCFTLPFLQSLMLGRNSFMGNIKNISSYSLEALDLSYNKLDGSFQKSIFELKGLTTLILASNNLTGLVDFEMFSKLENLEHLDLSENSLLSFNFNSNISYNIPNLRSLYLSSCNIRSFPKILQNLENFDLSNNKIHGKIPEWLHDLGKHSLTYLNLSHNFLTGLEGFSWKNLRYIDLSYNLLQGELPIPPISTIFFSISNNNLTGGISSSICKASTLQILNLSNNNLTGVIPQCLGSFSPLLSVLDLRMNSLSGTIPVSFPKKNSLRTLNLNGNEFKGPLPQTLAHCTSLEVLDLGNNKIEDTFPYYLENLQELQVLVLRGNKFHGAVRSFKSQKSFPKLKIFDASNNNFSGPLPGAYFENFRGMINDDKEKGTLHYIGDGDFAYHDSVSLIVKGNEMQLVKILTIFTTIDLSNNKFKGAIPSLIGELHSLKGLNLSHNSLTGSIPQSMGKLVNLEWLDLSSNSLTGNIPAELTNLNYLSFLNLSQNKLAGCIPHGKQFNTFTNSSFEGNLGLKGFPVSQTCTTNDKEQPELSTSHHEFGFGWKPVALGYGCGVVFGVAMGYVVFTTGKPQWLVRIVNDCLRPR